MLQIAIQFQKRKYQLDRIEAELCHQYRKNLQGRQCKSQTCIDLLGNHRIIALRPAQNLLLQNNLHCSTLHPRHPRQCLQDHFHLVHMSYQIHSIPKHPRRPNHLQQQLQNMHLLQQQPLFRRLQYSIDRSHMEPHWCMHFQKCSAAGIFPKMLSSWTVPPPEYVMLDEHVVWPIVPCAYHRRTCHCKRKHMHNLMPVF